MLVVIILGNAQNFKRSNTIHKKAASNAKQNPLCKKSQISAFAETHGFMLVEALPQSPQNTVSVFWNAG